MQVSRQLDSSFKNNFEILNRPSFGFTYLGFNLENPKFKDIKVRQALSFAINRQELVDILFLDMERFAMDHLCQTLLPTMMM